AATASPKATTATTPEAAAAVPAAAVPAAAVSAATRVHAVGEDQYQWDRKNECEAFAHYRHGRLRCRESMMGALIAVSLPHPQGAARCIMTGWLPPASSF